MLATCTRSNDFHISWLTHIPVSTTKNVDYDLIFGLWWLRIKHFVSWEPEYRFSAIFRWEPEGRYRCTKSMTIAPFWFLAEHCWTALMVLGQLPTGDNSPLDKNKAQLLPNRTTTPRRTPHKDHYQPVKPLGTNTCRVGSCLDTSVKDIWSLLHAIFRTIGGNTEVLKKTLLGNLCEVFRSVGSLFVELNWPL